MFVELFTITETPDVAVVNEEVGEKYVKRNIDFRTR